MSWCANSESCNESAVSKMLNLSVEINDVQSPKKLIEKFGSPQFWHTRE